MHEQFVGLAIIGFVAGIMSGMFGIGGGAIIVPALILFLNFDQTMANGTSLAALLLPVGIFACVEYYRAGKLKLWPAMMVALGLVIGAWFGAGFALDMDPTALRQSYGVFLLYMAWRYAAPVQWWREMRGGQKVTLKQDSLVDWRNARILLLCFLVGIVAGIFSGLFGIGGGVVIVPALMLLLHFDQKLATGTSLGALLMPVGLLSVVRYNDAGKLDLQAAVPIALMLVVGALLGARLALGLPTITVRRLYGLFLLVVGLRFLFGG